MIERLYRAWNSFEFDLGDVLGFTPLYRVSPFTLDITGVERDEPYWKTLNEVERLLVADGYTVGDRNHYINPHFANLARPERDVSEYGPNHWHTDSASGHERGDDVVVMCATHASDEGTLISGPLELPTQERFRLSAWNVYLLEGDVYHRAPMFRTAPCIVFRWYQSELGRLADNGQSDWDWRRDEDGALIWQK